MAKRSLSIFDMGSMAAIGGAGLASLFAESKAAEDEQTALDIEQTEAQEATTQRSIQRIQGLRQVMANATVQEATRGVSVASPSFKAVQRASFHQFNKDEDADALNLSFKETQIAAQRQNVRDKEMTSMFSSVLGMASSAATLAVLM